MNKLNELFSLVEGGEKCDSEPVVRKPSISQAERNLIQYVDGGNSFLATRKTCSNLKAGVYSIQQTMEGIIFSKHPVVTDELYRFKDSAYEWLFEEVEKFWGLKQGFEELGFTHKRGILMHGTPGTGKSALIKLMMEQIIGNDDVVFTVKDSCSLVAGLKTFREVEPDRKVFVVLEDIDGMCEWGGERGLLELFDGDNQVDNVLYIATTNYLERIPERLKRIGRFDKQFEVKFPNESGRRVYLEKKLAGKKYEADVDSLVKETDGLGFNHLKELLISVYCLKNDKSETLKRLYGSVGKVYNSLTESKLSHQVDHLNEDWFDHTASGVNDSARIKASLEKKLQSMNLEDVKVESVEITDNGNMAVTFSVGKKKVPVTFGVDRHLFPFAACPSSEKGELVIVELDRVGVPLIVNEFGGVSLDLGGNLNWLNPAVLSTILRTEDLSKAQGVGMRIRHEPTAYPLDAFGYEITSIGDKHFEVLELEDNGVVVETIYRYLIGKKPATCLPVIRRGSEDMMRYRYDLE